MKILVTAASRHGATQDIARAIADVLAGRGFDVTVTTPSQVASVADFDAVILGSAVYAGHWLASAKSLATRHGQALSARPVWLFSSGPVGDPAKKLTQQMGADPTDIPALMTATGARAHQVFAGKLDRKHLPALQRAALVFFRGLDGDFRDWDAIKGWAAGIAGQLTADAAA